jgi:hypothetical protein
MSKQPKLPSDQAWPRGFEGHEADQQARLAELPLSEKLAWLEEAHRLALHLQEGAGRADDSTSVEDLTLPGVDRGIPADYVTQVFTADDLARLANKTGKYFRRWLRAELERGNTLVVDHTHGERWRFSKDEAEQLLRMFRSSANSSSSRKRTTPMSFDCHTGTLAGSLGAEADRLLPAFDRSVRPQALDELPTDPGVYSFWTAGPRAICDLGLDDMEGEKSLLVRPLYIGKAEDSIAKRIPTQHFKTGKTGWSTARRTFAALLGFRSCLRPTKMKAPTSKQLRILIANYGVVPADEAKLTEWMMSNLLIRAAASRWTPLEALENELMLRLRPPLNLFKANWSNPWRDRIERARSMMRENARGAAVM